MPAPPTQDLRVIRYAPGWGYAAREWQAALAAIDWTAAPDSGGPRRLKQRADGDCTVWLATLKLPGREAAVVLKVDPLPHWRGLFRSWLGVTKAHRQWRGAALLERRGFRAAQSLAILRGNAGGSMADLLVLEALPGKTVLEHLADGDLTTKQQHALAHALGRHAARLADARLVNRDAKPSNLIISWDQGKPKIVALDTVAICRIDPVTGRTEAALTRMLRDLILEPLGCGFPPRRALMMRALRATAPASGRSWKSHRNAYWRAVDSLVADHGDPTPEDDPRAGAGIHRA